MLILTFSQERKHFVEGSSQVSVARIAYCAAILDGGVSTEDSRLDVVYFNMSELHGGFTDCALFVVPKPNLFSLGRRESSGAPVPVRDNHPLPPIN